MAWAIDTKTSRVYVTLEDRRKPEDEQTWFLIRDLPEKIQAQVNNALTISQDGRAMGISGMGDHRKIAVKNGLVGVEDGHPLLVLGPDGTPMPVPFEAEGRSGHELVADRFLSKVHPRDKAELCNAITRDPGLEQEHADLTQTLADEARDRDETLRMAKGPPAESRARDKEKSEPSPAG